MALTQLAIDISSLSDNTKRMEVEGAIAVGEKVSVTVTGLPAGVSTSARELRLRVLGPLAEDLATHDDWTEGDKEYTTTLDLASVQAYRLFAPPPPPPYPLPRGVRPPPPAGYDPVATWAAAKPPEGVTVRLVLELRDLDDSDSDSEVLDSALLGTANVRLNYWPVDWKTATLVDLANGKVYSKDEVDALLAAEAQARSSADAAETLSREAADAALSGRIGAEESAREASDRAIVHILDGCVNAASYDPDAKKILLKHDSTTVAEIDATEFIKDGMVSSVEIINGNLVITFNTDAGQEPISIPLTDIFNPDNYYDKAAADARFLQSQKQADWNESDTDDPAFIKNKPSIPAAQVQADWDESDADDPSYIKNKPNISGDKSKIVSTDGNTGVSVANDGTARVVTGNDGNAWHAAIVDSMFGNHYFGWTVEDPAGLPDVPVGATWAKHYIEEGHTKTEFLNNEDVWMVMFYGTSSSLYARFYRKKNEVFNTTGSIEFSGGKWTYTSSVSAFTETIYESAPTEKTVATTDQIPPPQVQADWDESDSDDDSYIQNKPQIPSITGKADKAVPAAAGNLAALDATGNLTDSGKKATDFAAAQHVHEGVESQNGKTKLYATNDGKAKIQAEVAGLGNAVVSFPDGFSIGFNDETYTAPSGGEAIEFYGPITSGEYKFFVPAAYKDEPSFDPSAQQAWCLFTSNSETYPNRLMFGTGPLYNISNWASANPSLTLNTGTASGGNPAMVRRSTVTVTKDVATTDQIPAAQVNADWNAASGVAQILNKPTIPDISGKADAAAIAPAFSSSSTYAVGDYVTHEGLLYKCTTAVSTAGAWNAANWSAVSITDEMGADTPLPFDAEVEYVTVPVGAYILPEVQNVSPDFSVDMSIRFQTAPDASHRFRCGNWRGASASSSQLYTSNDASGNILAINFSQSASIAYSTGDFYTAGIYGSSFVYGTNSITLTVSGGIKTPLDFGIGATDGGDAYTASTIDFDIRSFAYWSNGAPARSLVPVRVGTVGYLYDKISGRLFGSAVGSIPLVPGPDKATPTITTPGRIVELTPAIRYSFASPTPSVSGTAATVACEDRAINDFTVATGITSLTITPPAAVTRARDFFCRVTLTDSSLPTVTLSGGTIDIGSTEVAGMTQGVNLLMFTEIASGHWLASRRSAS